MSSDPMGDITIHFKDGGSPETFGMTKSRASDLQKKVGSSMAVTFTTHAGQEICINLAYVT